LVWKTIAKNYLSNYLLEITNLNMQFWMFLTVYWRCLILLASAPCRVWYNSLMSWKCSQNEFQITSLYKWEIWFIFDQCTAENFLSTYNTEAADSSEMLVPVCLCVTFTKTLILVLTNVRTSNFNKMNFWVQINAHHTNQLFTLKDGEYFVF
jgi:hypothetical protein